MSKHKGIYFKTGKYPGDMLNNVGNLNAAGSLFNKSKYSIRGAIIGGLGGFVLFSFLNKNKIVGTTIGAVIGAFGATIYNKINENIQLLKEYKQTQQNETK